ncbi:ubiquitin carboxyl-terminal hydrolase 18 isoform X2 [Capsicum annuum]|uniref:ubiquitin carboxyl-terminal hydrolase 18 isoform X2 n=1 Tax=Capsicum annuum TaxID=4072 RepID=UPI001FB0BA9E|nr:ubiquitin carboxyl-terminal hydrolase 18 isoform X2 [Capsicum annuum]
MKVFLPNSCAVCGNVAVKRCSRCKMVYYCSEACQRSDWNSGHTSRCRDFRSSVKGNPEQSAYTLQRRKSFCSLLVPSTGKTNILNQSKKVLFPYEDFEKYFYWDGPSVPPCGLINHGNSCYANVVLQCLTHTKPLAVYVVEKDHRGECGLNGWCFLCEFQLHVERVIHSWEPFSPIARLSELPNIGGNLSCVKQEDAHEFMRFAIDAMQSAVLDEFGGRTGVSPSTQETTVIQHIFGGHLQSQVKCSKCGNLSIRFENMMDLTVEIHGDAESLEDCLDQFTAEECMDGENMYKCDRCNDYVKASKRLMIQEAPNILTIALKRFQGGGGKLNKRVIFRECLDLLPYMNEGDDNDYFKLYAVIVHVNMLKASDFGHYICYIKDFSGSWYRSNDSKVDKVDIDEVLSQEAYMLLYRRIVARPTSLYPLESLNKEDHDSVKVEGKQHSLLQPLEGQMITASAAVCVDSGSLPTDNSSEIKGVDSGSLPTDNSSEIKVVREKEALPSITVSEDGKEDDQNMVELGASRYVLQEHQDVGVSSAAEEISYLGMLLSPCSPTDSSSETDEGFFVSDNEEETETSEGTANEDQDLVECGANRQEFQDIGVSTAAEEASCLRVEKTETCEGTTKEDQDMVESEASRYVLQELQDVGVSSAAEETSDLRMLSSLGWSIDSSAEAVIQKPEGRFLVSDIEEKTETCEGTVNESQLESSSEDSTDTRFEPLFPYGFLEKRKGGKEFSSQGIHDVILETDRGTSSAKKFKPLFPYDFLEKRKGGKEFSSQGIHDVILETDRGTSSAKKFKPLFPYGFLEKRLHAKTGLSCGLFDDASNEQRPEK